MEVLIIDSSAAIISRLKEMMSELTSVKVIYEASKCKNALALVKIHKPDIVLLDINLPGKESFNCLLEIRKAHGAAIIIALANRTSEIDELKYNLQGVEYFFDKYHEFEKIPKAIQHIANKEK